jgi:hypothetical protein
MRRKDPTVLGAEWFVHLLQQPGDKTMEHTMKQIGSQPSLILKKKKKIQIPLCELSVTLVRVAL